MTKLFGEDNGFFGRKHSDESRKLMSERKMGQGKGRKLSEETKQKISAARAGHTGRKHSEATKRKISAARAGRKGRKMSEETKQKISAAAKLRWEDPELRKAQSEKHTEKVVSVETREKMAKTRTGMKYNKKHRSDEFKVDVAALIKAGLIEQ